MRSLTVADHGSMLLNMTEQHPESRFLIGSDEEVARRERIREKKLKNVNALGLVSGESHATIESRKQHQEVELAALHLQPTSVRTSTFGDLHAGGKVGVGDASNENTGRAGGPSAAVQISKLHSRPESVRSVQIPEPSVIISEKEAENPDEPPREWYAVWITREELNFTHARPQVYSDHSQSSHEESLRFIFKVFFAEEGHVEPEYPRTAEHEATEFLLHDEILDTDFDDENPAALPALKGVNREDFVPGNKDIYEDLVLVKSMQQRLDEANRATRGAPREDVARPSAAEREMAHGGLLGGTTDELSSGRQQHPLGDQKLMEHMERDYDSGAYATVDEKPDHELLIPKTEEMKQIDKERAKQEADEINERSSMNRSPDKALFF
ncbi:unnamed protein product [Amoebophrya sp. A120]|nr:unnamed protein product [Amoebophrya sp. A120]|eukprot:GSA120T00002655001.1